MNFMKYGIFKTAIAAIALISMTACYDEQEGNDFDSIMPDMEIVVAQTAYSGSLGQTISIEPQIKTDIPEADLAYSWEVLGERKNTSGRGYYAPLVGEELQTRNLNFVCKLDSNITSLNKSYKCRLRVRQKSTGRDFYSTDNFTITIQGITGLMVLYDDDSQCDIGILQTEEFMPASSSLPESPKATSALFSSVNGEKLKGNGISIYQGVTPYIDKAPLDVKDRCRVLVRTNAETEWLDRNDLSVFGDWNAVFYLQGDRKVNAGIPGGYTLLNSWGVAFDGDDVFIYEPMNQPQYLFATYTPETNCNGHFFTFAPKALQVSTIGIQKLLYAKTVDGDKSWKGFVGISNGWLYGIEYSTKLLDTSDDIVAFNPGNMKADLVTFAVDQREHVMAVMKGDAGHGSYPGQYFLIDMYLKAKAAGGSGMLNYPVSINGMQKLENVENAIAFDFGSTQNMYYYATANALYHYGLDGTSLTNASKLTMANGNPVALNGEVTMMKMFRTGEVKRHDNDEILLVATWNGSASTLYALHLDTMTGNVTKASVYSADNVDGWKFGKIKDVHIKGL